jgi:hypothetical protein
LSDGLSVAAIFKSLIISQHKYLKFPHLCAITHIKFYFPIPAGFIFYSIKRFPSFGKIVFLNRDMLERTVSIPEGYGKKEMLIR